MLNNFPCNHGSAGEIFIYRPSIRDRIGCTGYYAQCNKAGDHFLYYTHITPLMICVPRGKLSLHLIILHCTSKVKMWRELWQGDITKSCSV